MTVENQTTEKQFAASEYTYNMGTVKQGSRTTVKALIKGAVHKETKVGCGSCTEAKVVQKENNIEVEMTYKANTIGAFNKPVAIFMADGRQINFKLKGTVI